MLYESTIDSARQDSFLPAANHLLWILRFAQNDFNVSVKVNLVYDQKTIVRFS